MSIFTTFETDNFIEIFDAAGTGVVAARVHGVSVGSKSMSISIFRHLCMLFSDFRRYFSTMRDFMSRFTTIMTSDYDFLARASGIIRTANGWQLKLGMCIRAFFGTFRTKSG